jgi:WD40 repeat protein
VSAVIQQLAESGLLVVATHSSDGLEQLEIIQDTVTTQWPELEMWIEQRRAFFTWEQRLARQAEEWIEHDRHPSLRLSGTSLAQALKWLEDEGSRDLGQHQLEFIYASAVLDKKRRIRVRVAGSIICLFIALFVVTSLAQVMSARRQLSLALVRQLTAQAQATKAGHVDQLNLSTLLALESFKRIPLLETDELLREATRLLPLPVLSAKAEEVIAFSSRSRFVALRNGENRLTVREIRSGKSLLEVNAAANAGHLAFSRDEQLLAIVSDRSVSVFTLKDGLQRWTSSFGSIKNNSWIADVSAIGFDASGKRVCITAGTLFCYDTASGQSSKLVDEKTSAPVLAWAFEEDGQRVAVLEQDSRSEWDSRTASVLSLKGAQTRVRIISEDRGQRIRFIGKGRFIAFLAEQSGSKDNDVVAVFDSATGVGIPRLKHCRLSSDGVFALAASSDRSWLTGQADFSSIVDLERNVDVGQIHVSGYSGVSFSEDDEYLAMVTPRAEGELHGMLQVFARQGREILQIPLNVGDGTHTSISGANRLVTVLDGPVVRTFRLDDGLEVLRHESSDQSTVRFSPDGRYFSSGAADGTVHIYEFTQEQRAHLDLSVDDLQSVIQGMEFLRPANVLAVSMTDGVRLFAVDSGRLVGSISFAKQSFGDDLSLNADAQVVALDSAKKGVEVLSVQSGRVLFHFLPPLTDQFSRGVTLSPSGQFVVKSILVDADEPKKAIVVFDVTTGNRLWSLDYRGSEAGISFSPDSKVVAMSTDWKVSLFYAKTGQMLPFYVRFSNRQKDLEFHVLTFDSRGQQLLGTNREGALQILDTSDGHIITASRPRGGLRMACFSPDGTMVGVLTWDHTAEIYEKRDLKPVSRARFQTELETAFFTPDSRFLMVGVQRVFLGGQSLRILQLPVRRTDLFLDVCSRLSRNLTPGEWLDALAAEKYSKTCPLLP